MQQRKEKLHDGTLDEQLAHFRFSDPFKPIRETRLKRGNKIVSSPERTEPFPRGKAPSIFALSIKPEAPLFRLNRGKVEDANTKEIDMSSTPDNETPVLKPKNLKESDRQSLVRNSDLGTGYEAFVEGIYPFFRLASLGNCRS
jgi:hypothetical protein